MRMPRVQQRHAAPAPYFFHSMPLLGRTAAVMNDILQHILVPLVSPSRRDDIFLLYYLFILSIVEVAMPGSTAVEGKADHFASTSPALPPFQFAGSHSAPGLPLCA